MSSTLLYCIIGGAVLLALIVATIFIRRSNKKRFQRLQENINKYKKENEAFDNDNRIVLSKDEPESEKQEAQPVVHTKPENAVIEDYYEEPPKPINQNRNRSNQYNYRRNNIKNAVKSQNQNEDDDFEQFLNEHSYSRKILSGDLISKLQDLRPEIKAVILSNVFNKYDDDK